MRSGSTPSHPAREAVRLGGEVDHVGAAGRGAGGGEGGVQRLRPSHRQGGGLRPGAVLSQEVEGGGGRIGAGSAEAAARLGRGRVRPHGAVKAASRMTQGEGDRLTNR